MKLRWTTSLILSAMALQGESAASSPLLPSQKLIVSQLAQFVHWPGGIAAGEPVIIGLAGLPVAEWNPAFTHSSRNVEFRPVSTIEQMRRCHIVLFGELLAVRLEHVLSTLAAGPVLTVAAIPGFARMGGMVELSTLAAGRRLTVNLNSARRAGFRIHPGLISVAEFLPRE